MGKRSLIICLTALIIMALSCPVFAAPIDTFADVPAGHWAYGAVKQLSKAGLVEGYGDGNFKGDKTMTRYEMAIVVANAMTKTAKADAPQKVLIEKLAKEFSDELTKLGARVAAVEKRANIFSFTYRLGYTGNSLGANDNGGWMGTKINQKNQFMERIRIYMNQPVGDEWYWSARMFMHKTNQNVADTSPVFDYLNVTNKNIAGGELQLGRSLLYPGKGGLICVPGYWNSAMYTKNFDNKVVMRLGDGRYSNADMSFAELTYRLTKLSDIGVYFLQNRYSGIRDQQMFTVFGNFEVGDGMSFSFEWAKNRAQDAAYNGKTAYWFGLNSKAVAGNYAPGVYTVLVNPNKKNDHGWGLSYRHIPSGATGYANRGASAAWVPYSTDTAGSYQNAFDNINAVRFDYQWIPWKRVWAIFTYDHIKPIGGGWLNNSYQLSLNFVI